MDFTDKVVVITGASSGIGASAALEFAKHSAKLVLTGRNAENLNKVAEDCEKAKGIKALTIPADVTKEGDVEKIVQDTIKHYGKIDVLVNNAGAGKPESVLNPSLKIFDDTINLNIRAVYHLTTLFVPHLIKTKGNIVNISSVASTSSNAVMVSYSMAKAALDHFTRLSANELAPKGVRVNCINPGLTITNFLARMMGDEEKAQQMYDQYSPTIPLGRASDTSEIADAILYFASDLAKSITGQTLKIDGGISMKV